MVSIHQHAEKTVKLNVNPSGHDSLKRAYETLTSYSYSYSFLALIKWNHLLCVFMKTIKMCKLLPSWKEYYWKEIKIRDLKTYFKCIWKKIINNYLIDLIYKIIPKKNKKKRIFHLTIEFQPFSVKGSKANTINMKMLNFSIMDKINIHFPMNRSPEFF